jgi:F420-non-reducing hydrogenase iron-sulfur subunit
MEDNKANLRDIVVFECASVPAGGSRDAATTRHGWPSSAKRILVPCSGKLQPEHLLKAFENGADLVVVLTCGEGECRYLEGRQRIERRVDYVRGLLDDIGLGRERLMLLDRDGEPDLSAMAQRELTPSPLGGGKG